MHDVTELYVRLRERYAGVVYEPEEWARPTLGGITLHPDVAEILPPLRSTGLPNFSPVPKRKCIRGPMRAGAYH